MTFMCVPGWEEGAASKGPPKGSPGKGNGKRSEKGGKGQGLIQIVHVEMVSTAVARVATKPRSRATLGILAVVVSTAQARRIWWSITGAFLNGALVVLPCAFLDLSGYLHLNAMSTCYILLYT